METAPRRPTDEELLSHREWVRSLARALAGVTALADDLEQETLATALRSPPPRGGLGRAWLGTVLRNLHRRSFRSADRVRRREEAAARPEAGPGASDVVARAEAHRRVVDAVLSLAEPARTAVLLRFFDGLPPREVARRTGVPVETARTRLKRAVEDLRARLGGERGREGLLALIVPLVRPAEDAGSGAAASAAGGIAMGTAAKVAIAAGAVALVAGGTVAWRTLGGDVEPPPTVPSTPPSPATPAPPPDSTEVAVQPSPALPSLPAPAPPRPGAEETREEARDPADITGLDFDFSAGTTLSRAVEEVARAAGLGHDYESAALRSHCEGTLLPSFQVKGVPLADMMDLLLANARSPEKGRALAWELRGSKILLLLKKPPPPRQETADEVKRREDREKALRERLHSEKTSFVFVGQTVSEAFSYLSARHAVNIAVEGSAQERCDSLTVKLSLSEIPLDEALDELLRLAPDLLWEVRGNVVQVRRR